MILIIPYILIFFILLLIILVIHYMCKRGLRMISITLHRQTFSVGSLQKQKTFLGASKRPISIKSVIKTFLQDFFPMGITSITYIFPYLFQQRNLMSHYIMNQWPFFLQNGEFRSRELSGFPRDTWHSAGEGRHQLEEWWQETL